MYFSLPFLFGGALLGVILSAVMAPPTRKSKQVPTPNDPTTYKVDTGCVRVRASEVPCTADTDSLNLLGTQHK
jgi:hypothetical protein